MSSDEALSRNEDTQAVGDQGDEGDRAAMQTATETATQTATDETTGQAETAGGPNGTHPSAADAAQAAATGGDGAHPQVVPPGSPQAMPMTTALGGGPVTAPGPGVSNEAAAVSSPTAESPAAPAVPQPPSIPAESRPRPQIGVQSPDVKAVPNVGGAASVQPAVSEPPRPASRPATQAPQAPPRAEQKSGDETTSETSGEPPEKIGREVVSVERRDLSAEYVPPKGPVAVPKADELDDELAAAIDQAMEGDKARQPQAETVPPPEAAGAPAAQAPAGEQAAPPKSEEELTQGQRLQATIQSVTGDDVFVDVGLRSPGVVSVRQFEQGKEPQPGQTIQVTFEKFDAAQGLLHFNLPRGRRKVGANWDAVEAGQTVDCTVVKTNKGGLEVTVSSLRGFLPASQVDLNFVSDLEKFVGQKLTCRVMEVNPAKRNLIVSRREVLKEERAEKEQVLWQNLSVGQTFTGTVKTLKDYGAFIDIGGADGFLHIGEMSWTRIRHPKDILTEGQQVEVQIISLDTDRKRIGLGMKQLKVNPWDKLEVNYPVGATVSGTVTRTTDFGAFVELEPGVEGLVHISELDYSRVKRVTDVLKEGDTAEFKVLDVDPQKKRISLSVKALKEKPPELQPKSDADLAPGGDQPYERKRKGPLRGGTGPTNKGGLFGNPDDFQ
jgi:small subunit ribosomal protein S1